MSETPRTDANHIHLEFSEGPFKTIDYVPVETARQLERELNSWRSCAAELAEAMRGSSEILRQSALAKFEKLKSQP